MLLQSKNIKVLFYGITFMLFGIKVIEHNIAVLYEIIESFTCRREQFFVSDMELADFNLGLLIEMKKPMILANHVMNTMIK